MSGNVIFVGRSVFVSGFWGIEYVGGLRGLDMC
jgi:hypothetical protein